MTKYGITCFRSQNVPLYGELKVSPSDFVVREVNLHGKIAGIDSLEFVDSPLVLNEKTLLNSEDTHVSQECFSEEMDPSGQCKKRKISNSDYKGPSQDNVLKRSKARGKAHENPDLATYDPPLEKNTPVKETKANDDILWADIREKPESCISDLIGKDVLKSLRELSIDPDSCREIDIGIYNDKKDRRVLHQCLRFLFPSLISIPSKVGMNTKITCKIDPVFNELKSLQLDVEKIKELLVFINCRLLLGKLDSTDDFVVDVTAFEKEQRKSFHHLISQKFGKFLESKTFLKGGSSHMFSIRFRKRIEKPKSGKRKMETSIETEIYGVTLTRENMEQLHVIKVLSQALDVNFSAIKYAGTKDKKAITHQFVSIIGTNLTDIQNIVHIHHSGWRISKPAALKKELQLGELKGNRFEIILRNIKENTPGVKRLRDILHDTMTNISKRGFLNYFGEQRFGSDMTTSRIGVLLIRRKFIDAVKLMFKPSSNEQEVDSGDNFEKAKQIFSRTNDVTETLKYLPSFKTRELLVMKSLKKYAFDEPGCIKAFMALPHASRLFYIHSFCSLIWNRVLSRRIEEKGFEVLPGDLVFADGSTNCIKHISKNDIDSKLYTFDDIVLPLPGTAVDFPENETKQMYLHLLREEGLELNELSCKELQLNISGTYRKVLEFPKDLEWELIDNGKNLKVEFFLKRATYATIALREILH